ncbi:putative lipid II flippase FtsW [Pseudomonas neustonica]|mgnify:CR=1 FL=1|uniref:Probable peptidoglycan glycosyltransferase FtsW n=1 Tax=Pseudomonas neustonica TaxID=2487346 RepID=A0ABX9XFL4_9PSED|nr:MULTISPECIES: putative lipid II flippase FtsW [Pseudomonas]MAB24811.1 putative lipid II flippase FtsW [Pseudomonadales bacterium]MBA6418197.1 putative lipid II flippase FtsW [Pseudomonas sp. 5Ae-yellow]ROZ81283.1 putative lipid II flippase FtsW [Pseudomonas sp. SSM44]ROZ82863.1 putative lipid II flippase FtsW [Pseudomonas neustonica]|tara:strand:+ start:321 stop:1496 length:1176 start_codon:yes stop_codon:yes gene_type:complete
MNWLATARDASAPLIGERRFDMDLPLLVGSLCLLALGLVMVTSASMEVAAGRLGDPLYYMNRQIVYLVIGLLAMAATLAVPVRLWEQFRFPLLFLGFALLLAVLIPGIGREVNGSWRWIAVGPINVQPSELAKLFAVVFLSGYLVHRQAEVKEQWFGFIKPFMVLGPMAWLLIIEPDFGATVVLMGAATGMLFLGGVGLFRFLLLFGSLGGLAGLLVAFEPYRLQRLTGFLNPWDDPYGTGYQLTQALIAFGRGEWLGVGLGNSIQKQFYLPEAHTDFVFSVLAEELGMIGALAAFALLIFVAVRALYIGLWAERAGRMFSAYLAYGLAIMWCGQVLINVGVNIGLLPTKGLTLPFLSYGGSSLVVCCVSLGLLLRIDWERRQALREAANG